MEQENSLFNPAFAIFFQVLEASQCVKNFRIRSFLYSDFSRILTEYGDLFCTVQTRRKFRILHFCRSVSLTLS